MLVMLHKIPYAHFTEWNNKRKRKAFAAGIYFLSIIPEFVLLAGTFLAARGQDGYVHLVNVPQKVVFYGLAGLAGSNSGSCERNLSALNTVICADSLPCTSWGVIGCGYFVSHRETFL